MSLLVVPCEIQLSRPAQRVSRRTRPPAVNMEPQEKPKVAAFPGPCTDQGGLRCPGGSGNSRSDRRIR
jgi:hypothetical protein